MKRYLIILFAGVLMGGCATVESTLDVLSPMPEPVCGKNMTGVLVGGKVCAQYTDGSYRWVVAE